MTEFVSIKMNDWDAKKTENPQGADFREVAVEGKLSELTFTVRPESKYWRAGFKLLDPNDDVFPVRSKKSLLFHLGSTPSDQEYGFTAYLNGDPIYELNKTKKYPTDKLLVIKLEINNDNFLKVAVNESLEFKPRRHLKNPYIREKVVLIAWGDEYEYKVNFSDIMFGSWKDVRDKRLGREKSKPMLQITGNENVFFKSHVDRSAIVSENGNKLSKIGDSSKKKESETPWHKNPTITVPAAAIIIGAVISAPWWTQVLQNRVSVNGLGGWGRS